MRWKSATVVSLFAAVSIGFLLANAQPEGGKKKGKGDKGPGGPAETVATFVEKMMAFNKAKDGKLTKKELTDARLHGLFDRADANKDGVVTKEELEVLYAKEGGGDQGGPGGDKGGKGKGPKSPPPEGKKDKAPPLGQVNEPPSTSRRFQRLSESVEPRNKI